MSLELIKDKLVKTAVKSQWEKICAHRKRNLNDEYIFVRYSSYESKTRGILHRVQINIGDKVASLFGLSEGKRIVVFFDRSNTNLFLLKVSEDEEGCLLSKAKRAVVLTLNCTIPYAINLPKKTTVPVFFDVESDDSILIDISKKPK